MSTTRYIVPVPEFTPILETRQQLNDMAMEFPLGTVDDRNGGYYLLDHDATVLAIASDSLCEELDASMEAAKRYHSAHPEIDEETKSVAPQSVEADSGLSKRSCTHPRCHTHALCRTYSDCHVCSSSFHWCFWTRLRERWCGKPMWWGQNSDEASPKQKSEGVDLGRETVSRSIHTQLLGDRQRAQWQDFDTGVTI